MKSTEFAKEVRKLSLEMVYNSKASHIGSALSMVDILSVLYCDVVKYKSKNPQWEERDFVILSKGHACVSLYATLALKNFFDKSELKNYGKNDSNFMNHVSHKVPGVEFSTGSLGHGLPYAVGICLANKSLKNQSLTYVILGDGELAEGSNWEALLFASHHNLKNLIVIIDYNNLQSLTSVEETLSLNPLSNKLESFGCAVHNIEGHDHDQLKETLTSIKSDCSKPTVIIAKTTKGKGVSYMENKVEWHYKSPDEKQFTQAIQEIANA